MEEEKIGEKNGCCIIGDVHSGNTFSCEGNNDVRAQEQVRLMRETKSENLTNNIEGDNSMQDPADGVEYHDTRFYTTSTDSDYDMKEMTLDLPQNSDKSLDYKTKCIICGPSPEITQAEYTKLASCLDIQTEIRQLLKILSPPNEFDACCKRCLDLMKNFMDLKSAFQSVKQKIISLHIDAQLKAEESYNSEVSESDDNEMTDTDLITCDSNKQEQKEELVIKHENIDIEYNDNINSTPEKVIANKRRNPTISCKHKCKFCYKTYTSRLGKVEHERTHTGERPFKCQYCFKTFHGKMACVGHEKREHIQKPFQCQVCFRSFRTMKEYEDHESTHTAPRPFQCQHCIRTFKRKEDWVRHERTHTGERPFKCIHCERSYTERSALTKHEKKKHPGLMSSKEEKNDKKEIVHSCDHCDQLFEKKDDLIQHEKAHEFKCSHCGKSCWGMQALKQHERNHTREKPFKCSICEFSCFNESTLKEHMRTHSDERPYLCQYCSKGFKQRATLFLHERSQHTKVRPYKCQYCDQGFPTRILSEEHERYHTGEKPFQCDYCDKRFMRKSQWKSHLRIHLGIKPHVCSYCGKAFRDRRHLEEHERTHTGDRPYKCQHCDKAYAQKYSYIVHMRKHPGEAKNAQSLNEQKQVLSKHVSKLS